MLVPLDPQLAGLGVEVDGLHTESEVADPVAPHAAGGGLGLHLADGGSAQAVAHLHLDCGVPHVLGFLEPGSPGPHCLSNVLSSRVASPGGAHCQNKRNREGSSRGKGSGRERNSRPGRGRGPVPTGTRSGEKETRCGPDQRAGVGHLLP